MAAVDQLEDRDDDLYYRRNQPDPVVVAKRGIEAARNTLASIEDRRAGASSDRT